MEGDSVSGLIKLIQKAGYNKDIEVREGVITSLIPLKIAISNNIIFEEDDIKISKTFKNQLDNKYGEVEIDRAKSVNLSTGEIITEKFKYTIKEFEGKEVKVGNTVIGLLDNNEYYVIDRVVSI